MVFRRKSAEAAPEAALPEASASESKAAAEKPKKSWFEKRRERRKKRKIFEEIIAWIIVPAFVYGAYLIYKAVGGLPPGSVEFLSEVMSTLLRGGK